MKKKAGSPGYYTPMDIAPGEYSSTYYTPDDYKSLKESILNVLEKDWGPRCGTKDTDEFDDLIAGTDNGRCPCCLVYEKFDNFWDYFDHTHHE